MLHPTESPPDSLAPLLAAALAVGLGAGLGLPLSVLPLRRGRATMVAGIAAGSLISATSAFKPPKNPRRGLAFAAFGASALATFRSATGLAASSSTAAGS